MKFLVDYADSPENEVDPQLKPVRKDEYLLLYEAEFNTVEELVAFAKRQKGTYGAAKFDAQIIVDTRQEPPRITIYNNHIE